MSLDFSTGKYDATTKVFTAADGKQYYVQSDSCAANPLSQTCNTQYCDWGPWKEDADGKASCVEPCSTYVYKQYSTCPNGKCDDKKSLARVQYLPCGDKPCAQSFLTQYGNCSASCGGGTQERSCKLSVLPVSKNLPRKSSIGVPEYSTSSYVENTISSTSSSAFTDRSSSHRYVGPTYSWFVPHDSPNDRF